MDTIESIPEGKRAGILNAAMLEFADKGYARASTNTIVRQAGIAKGLLFHYFASKKQLYLSVYDYALRVTLDEFYNRLDLTERDLFKRLRQAQMVKLELLTRSPHVLRFIQSAYTEQSGEVQADIHARDTRLLAENLGRIYSNLDFTALRDGLEPAMALHIVQWSVEGLTNRLIARAQTEPGGQMDYNAAFREMDAYLDFLKQCLYR